MSDQCRNTVGKEGWRDGGRVEVYTSDTYEQGTDTRPHHQGGGLLRGSKAWIAQGVERREGNCSSKEEENGINNRFNA